MGEWRRKWQGEQQGLHHHHHNHQDGWWGPTGTAKYGRPPTSPAGSWHQKLPSWEKIFCTSVCSISWKKLCETKKVMYMYKNVVQWNDSAGEEAFRNAKARFWAEINGLHCGIPLPDPDIYIDVVDQEAVIDPQLMEDLYKQPPAPDDGERDPSFGWDSFIFSDKPVPVSGWGDEDDPVPTNGDKFFDSGCDASNSVGRDTYGENPVDSYNTSNCVHNETSGEYGNAGSEDGGWGEGVVFNNTWGDSRDNSWGNWENRNNESGKRGVRKKDGGGRFGPRRMNPNYQGEYHQTNKNWRNCRGRNWVNYTYEHSVHDKLPQETMQWNSMHSCCPMNHQGSAESGGAWQLQKSVS